MSTEAERKIEALRLELSQRRDEHGTIFSFEVTERQLVDLASGYVPPDCKAMFTASLSWAEDDRARADAARAQEDHKRKTKRKRVARRLNAGMRAEMPTKNASWTR